MGIYHPPPSNNTTNATFMDEISEPVADRRAKYNNMVILGDLNISCGDLTNNNSHIFNDTMHAFGFKQHVASPTHKCGPPPRPNIQQNELRGHPPQLHSA